MRSRVKAFTQEYGMILPGMNIVAGISGGADSVCLLFLLREFCAEEGARLTAVHVNHGLRGSESDGDEEFVRDLCEKWNVKLRVFRFDVKERAAREKLSLEEAGRLCRYEAFEEAAREGAEGLADSSGYRIAVAHHMDDQAETMLFNLFRGSGIRGLCGMRPVKGNVIRPFLCVDRSDILGFIDEEGLTYRTDSSNMESGYSRNFIRNSLLPQISREINPAAARHAAGTAAELSLIEEYLENETEKAYKAAVTEDGGGLLVGRAAFENMDPLIQSRVLRSCMARTGGLKDVTREHIMMLQRLMAGRTGASADLPNRRTAVRTYDGIKLGRRPGAREDLCGDAEYTVAGIPGSMLIDGRLWTFSIIRADKLKNIPQKRYTKFFDCDRIFQNLTVRHRRPGDYIEINAEHGRKTLKKYFTDEKIPAADRGDVWLLADGSHVLWIVGYRISEGYKVTAGTKRILKAEVDGGEEDG